MHVAADLTESPTHTSVTETEATTAKPNSTELCITGIIFQACSCLNWMFEQPHIHTLTKHGCVYGAVN